MESWILLVLRSNVTEQSDNIPCHSENFAVSWLTIKLPLKPHYSLPLNVAFIPSYHPRPGHRKFPVANLCLRGNRLFFQGQPATTQAADTPNSVSG